MKIPRTANAVGHIDDDLITAAAESKTKAKRSRLALRYSSSQVRRSFRRYLAVMEVQQINIKTSSRRVNLQLFGRGNIRQYMKNTRN